MKWLKWSNVWFVAGIACLSLMFIDPGAALFWFCFSFVCLWRSDFHQLSEQLLEIKERLDK